jgi:hypothetical protein
MDVALVAAAAVVTYGSRAAAIVFLPPPTGKMLTFIERLPAPLFAGLAVFALVGDAAWPEPPALCAAAAALAVAPRRSLAVTLAAGLAAYLLGTVLW